MERSPRLEVWARRREEGRLEAEDYQDCMLQARARARGCKGGAWVYFYHYLMCTASPFRTYGIRERPRSLEGIQPFVYNPCTRPDSSMDRTGHS